MKEPYWVNVYNSGRGLYAGKNNFLGMIRHKTREAAIEAANEITVIASPRKVIYRIKVTPK